MILGLWLDQPVWLMFGLLAALFLAMATALSLLTNLRATRPLMLTLGTGIVPTYFTAVSVLLALLTGFVANDAWERQRQAARVVQTERANALAAHDLSRAAASDMRAIREALAAYLDAVIDDEWPRMAAGAASGAAAPRAGEALERLLRTAADPRTGEEAGNAAHNALLDAVMNLRAARGERLALSNVHGDQSKWLTLLILAGLTLIAVGLVHLERPYAQATSLAILCTAMVTTLGMVAMHERPFDGPMAVSPAPLQAARTTLEPPAP